MAEITRTTAKTYFNTGDTPTEAQFANVLDSVPFPLSDAVFTVLSGTTWDGSFKSLTLSSNVALTFASTRRSGVLIVKQDATGSRTLTINGSSAAINSAANSTSIITFIYNDVISDYVFSVATVVVGVTGGLDTTAPTLLSAVINNGSPSNLLLTYSEPLDSASTPATTDFDIQVNGSARNRDSVSISGAVITLHLVSPVLSGDVITVSYLAGGTNKIKDVAGNLASAFINTSVTNNVAASDTTPPTVVSKTTTDATHIRVVFSESVTASLLGWTFKKNGSPLGASAVSGSGTAWDFTVGTMAAGDTLLISYDSSTGNTVDAASNELVSFTDSAVTNSIVGVDTDAQAYITAEETAASITIDTTNRNAIDKLIKDLKAGSNVWAKTKGIYLGYGTGLKNAKNLSLNASTSNAPAIGATGYVFDGVNDAINTNIIPATHLAANTEFHAIYVKSSTDDKPVFACLDSGMGHYFYPRSSGNRLWRIQRGSDNTGSANATATGRYVMSLRGTAPVFRMTKDGTQVEATAGSSLGLSTYPVYLGALNNTGTIMSFNACTIGLYIIGLDLSDTQMSELDTAINTFITATSRT